MGFKQKKLLSLGTLFLSMGLSIYGADINVSAAISLKESLDEIAKKFQVENPGDKIFINYGGSSALRKQIENGAPVDVVLFADTENIDKLQNQGLIKERAEVLYNSLVVAGIGKKINSLGEARGERIAIADPEIAPLGAYSKEYLKNTGLYETLKENLIIGQNAKTVFNYVESGDVDYGIIYRNEVKNLKNAQVIMEVDPSTYSKPIYGFGVIENNKEDVDKFFQYVQGDQAKEIFVKNGFKVLK